MEIRRVGQVGMGSGGDADWLGDEFAVRGLSLGLLATGSGPLLFLALKDVLRKILEANSIACLGVSKHVRFSVRSPLLRLACKSLEKGPCTCGRFFIEVGLVLALAAGWFVNNLAFCERASPPMH